MYSCSKLNTVPTDFLAPETYYTTEAQLNAGLTGVYDCLQKGNMFSGGDGLATVFNVTDEMYYAQNGTGPKVWAFTASERLVNNIWSACYTGIQRANVVLANIEKPEMADSSRQIVKGEVKFLRAFFYFVLVQNFGDVPLRKEPTPSVTDVNIKRTPANEVYDFIIREMTEAESLLPPVGTYTYNERPTKQAAEGMLARICLFKAGFPNNDVSKYAEAAQWAKKAIASGLLELNPDYGKVFVNMVQDRYDIKESVWEIGYYTTGVGDAYKEYSPSLGVTLGVNQTDGKYGVVTGAYRIHKRLYDLFEKDANLKGGLADPSLDLRRDVAIANFKYTGNRAPNKTYYTADQIYDRQPNKFDRINELTENKFQSNTSCNFPALRYSDILLMFAEAENEANGPTQEAIDALNEVRRRGYGKLLNGEGVKSIALLNSGSGYTTPPGVVLSGGGGSDATARAIISGGSVTAIEVTSHGVAYTGAPVVVISGGGGSGATAAAAISKITDADVQPAQYLNKDAFRKLVQDERARELCFEGWRRLDLMRWGILVSTLRAVAAEDNIQAPTAYRNYATIGGNNIGDVNNYLPIPTAEIALNKLITQNPGW